MQRDPFVGLLLLSVALHVGAVWVAMRNFDEPVALLTQKGPVSIRLAPSQATTPRPTPKVPEPRKEELLPAPQPEEEALLPQPERAEPQPELLPLPETVKASKPKVDERKPEVLPPPTRVVEAPKPRPKKVERKPEVLPPPMLVEEPTPKKVERKPDLEQKIAESSLPTPSSPASEESRGTQTEPISLSTNPAFDYPPEDLLAGREGIVYVRLKIDATGRVTSAVVESGTGTERMAHFATVTLLRWRFMPARQNGVAVPVERMKPVEFHIRRP